MKICNKISFKKDFPFFAKNDVLVFLDSASSTQKPQIMLDTLNEFYLSEYSNIHRGIYKLSSLATKRFEETREKVAKFINAFSKNEIVFTKGATESINLVAHSYGYAFISSGEEIIISEMEHNSNIMPWKFLCDKLGAKLQVIQVDENGELSLDHYKSLLSEKTSLVAITYASNVLGTINPIKEITKLAHQVGAKVLVDACQAIVHLKIDVQDLDCDFLVFSAHKLYGPNGVGILYGKENILNSMQPYQLGGGVVDDMTFENISLREAPFKFEAGTHCIAEVISFGSTIDYLIKIRSTDAILYENSLLLYITEEMQKMQNFRIWGTAQNKIGIVSFTHSSAHPADISYILDQQNIAIRSGHHCAHVLMKRFGVNSMARASIGLYNDFSDIDKFLNAIHKLDKFFS